MQTLYDLLGALPRDDAEELRAAFRRAVKGAHPDLNPGDPEAGKKFREILRANEILGDEEQRAAYDHLLDLAQQEQSRQANARTMHGLASGMLALVVVAAGGIGGYLTRQNLPEISAGLKHIAAVATASPGDFAGLPPAPVDAGPHQGASFDARAEASQADLKAAEAKGQMASIEALAADKAETTASIPGDTIPPIAASPQAQSENAAQAAALGRPLGPPLEITPADAKLFRERGIFAYRSGDLDGAIAEFDHAIQLDPKFSAAYVDRGIVLYRMQKFERAFADIAHAKRIERTKRSRVTQSETRKKTAAALGFPPFFQRRTAGLD
jgi:tetratricopeptide (TPR) repeat protein